MLVFTARDLIHTHHGSAVGVECGLAQGLGQHVRRVLGGGDVEGLDDVLLDQLTDEEVAPGDVLGLVVVHWVMGQVDGAGAVHREGSGVGLLEADLLKDAANSDCGAGCH